MMTKEQKDIYLELLRSALWEHEINISVFKGEFNWKLLIETYRNQDMLGLVANTIMSLPGNMRPNIIELSPVISYFGSIIKAHSQLNKRLSEIMPKLQNVGCRPMLLKGQGLSVLYPKKCFRACGDLDIYVGEEKFEDAKKVVNAMATPEEIEDATEISHHYEISIKGIIYEIHRTLGVAGNRSYKSAFLSMADKYLASKANETETLSVTPSENTQIEVPALELNVWYVFNHLMEHFTDSGVSLRQFCDWMLVVHEYYNRYGKTKDNELKDTLKKIGLLRAWKIMGGILVYQLGLPSEEFPLYDERLAKKSQCYIIDDMLDGDRFRFASYDKIKEQGKGIKRILNSMRYYYYDCRPLFVLSPLAPYTTCVKYWWQSLRNQ